MDSDQKHEPSPRGPFRLVLVALWLGLGAICVQLSPSDQKILGRTFLLGLTSSLIALPVGGLIAWVCSHKGTIAKLIWLSSIALTFTPMLIHVSAWDAAFGKLGWLTAGQGGALKPLVSGWAAAIWIHGISAAPQVGLFLTIGMSSFGRTYEEQASLDASPITVFARVTLFRLFPLLILSVIWIVIGCAREIAVTDLYQIGTLAEQIYLGYSLGLNSIAGTWTAEQIAEAGQLELYLPWILVAVLTLLGIILFTQLTQLEFQSSQQIPRLQKTSSWLCRIIGSLIIIVGVVIPISNVIARACFFVKPVDAVPTQGYSIGQMIHSVGKSIIDYQQEFVWSFLIAITTTILIMVAANLLAFLCRRSRGRKFLFATLLAFSCALPGPFIGSLVGSLFRNLPGDFFYWLSNYTIAAPVIASFLFCWPITAALCWFLVRNVPNDILENSQLEKVGFLRRLVTFGILAHWRSQLGCLILTLALTFGELSASHMVRPAGMDTVPRKMLGDLHAGVNEMTAGITIVMAAIIFLMAMMGSLMISSSRPFGNLPKFHPAGGNRDA
ncbi:MAG: hypothetical protein AAF623_03085 [Planctomycetota bacterium]